jgi:hypothetical protein
VSIPNRQGETPHSFARNLKHRAIEQFLVSNGAESSQTAADNLDLDTCNEL